MLIDLARDMTLSKTIQLIKGESSYWVNKNKMIEVKFAWQDDYYAASVSHSQVNDVRKYINNQEEHHKKMSTKEEIEMLLKKLHINHFLQ